MRQSRHLVRASRAAALVLVTGGLLLPSGLPGAAAEPAGDGCVRYSELRQVEKGMSRARVERIFGTRRSSPGNGGAGGYSRIYASCDGEHRAVVEYAVPRQGATPRASGFKRWLPA